MHSQNLSKIVLILLFAVCCFSFQSMYAVGQETQEKKVFEDDFKSRYSSRKYNYEGRKVVNSTFNTKNGENAEYDPNDPNIKEDDNRSIFSSNFGINWIFVLILIIAVIYLANTILSEGSSGWFSSRENKSLKDYQTFNVETASTDEFLKLISDAENNNNFRLAIRYYFLFVLKNMSLKNIIKIEEDKTNAEYLQEIKHEALVRKFSTILYLYNYTWYGEFNVNALQYKTAKANFNTFLNQIKK